MKHWATLGLATLVIVMAAGCSKNKDVNEPESYDPKTSAPPSAVVVVPNPTLLQDQAAVAKAELDRQAARMAATAPGAEPVQTGTTSAKPSPVEAVPTTGAASPKVTGPGK